MKEVIVFIDYFVPGYKAGGPIPSVSRIIERDKNHHFNVITRNKDLGDPTPYPTARRRSWVKTGRAQVAYLGNGIGDALWIQRQIRRMKPHVYYFNSLHSFRFTLLPLAGIKVGLLPKRSVIIAPRGETSPGARGLRRKKKAIFRPIIKWLVGASVTWHLSSPLEQSELDAWWGKETPISHRSVIWPDLAQEPSEQLPQRGPAARGKVVFVSRIDRMKGLIEAIEILSMVEEDFSFDIHGVISDKAYWKECCDLAEKKLAINSWEYLGAYEPTQTPKIFSEATVFIFPTLGENFGHVIAESLSVGCPIALSGTTPWNEVIEAGGGHLFTNREEAANYLNSLLRATGEELQKTHLNALSAYRIWFDKTPHHDFEALAQ